MTIIIAPTATAGRCLCAEDGEVQLIAVISHTQAPATEEEVGQLQIQGSCHSGSI